MPSRKKLWADSLPKSPNTGVAIADNCRFNPDGSILSRRENEDGYFNCIFNSTSLLMVLDGHDGKKAHEYVKNEMPELIVKMVENTVQNNDIKTKFTEIFKNVDKGFFRSIDDLLTERAVLKIELDECLNSSVALERYPKHVDRVSELDEQIKGGTTVAVTVIKHDKLFVANVGDTRVLLCLINPQNNYLLVDQLTVDHNTSCEEELQRLKSIGLNPDKLRRAGRLGTQQNTRCIGDFIIKNGYTDIDVLKDATKPPAIAVPHVAGPVMVNHARGFVIVMSDGLYDAWSAYTGKDTSEANIAIAGMVAEQIKGNQRMEDVARFVINSVVSSVKTTFTNSRKPECSRLDDITLMVHNLGYDALEWPISRIVQFPLTTTPAPSIPPPMSSHFSQPGGTHQGQSYGNVYQGYNPPIHHMAQSYDPNHGLPQFPVRGQPPTNYYTPTPVYQHPSGMNPENPFVFPNSQPVPPGPPQYPQTSGQGYPGTSYNMSANQWVPAGVNDHNRSVSSSHSSSSYIPATNQSSSINSSYNSSYGGNMPVDSHGNQGLNFSGNVSNSLVHKPSPQHQQLVGRHSVSPVPPQVNYSAPHAQPHPPQGQQAPGHSSTSAAHLLSTSDEDGESTPIADPSGKEVFPTNPSSVKKPVPLPRTKSIPLDENQTTPIKTADNSTEIPLPQSSSTPKKENESQRHIRDSLDASNLKDEELYESDKEGEVEKEDTFEAPVAGGSETLKLAKQTVENQPPLQMETAKSSGESQLDQYIFDSDGEMENQLEVQDSDQSTSDEEIDDDQMGTVDTSKLSLMTIPGEEAEEPAHNEVLSYIKFDNFPDIEYDAL